MEHTTRLMDFPPTVVRGSDGPFLDPFGKEGRPLIDSPSCSQAQETGCNSSSCPHRQACYETLSEWAFRHGKYQREDITASDRLDIARRFHDPERPWGEVTGIADQYDVSRQTIYNISERGELLFKPRLPGPVPCLKQLLPCGAEFSRGAVETEAPSREEKERARGRLILTSVFPGGVTMRPLEEILKESLVGGCSATTIWRLVDEAGTKAQQVMAQVDYADIALPPVLVDVDETFFDGRPILFVVEPVSLAICGFHVPADGKRSSITWDPLLLLLQEDQHLDIYAGVGDAAKPYPSTFEMLLGRDDRFQEDVFHQLRDLGRLRRKLENSTYRAFATEYEAIDQWQDKGTVEKQEEMEQAQAESIRLAGVHDAFAEYRTWVADAFQIVDLRSGEIRDRAINEWLLDEAIDSMAQLDHSEVVKMSERLANHKDRLLIYLDWLEEQLTPLREKLHAYLDEPELEKAVLRAVARRWRLQHEVQSMQRRAFRPSLKRAEQELAVWIAGDAFLEQWAEKVHKLLEWVQRASSAVENINSIFKPLVVRKKHFESADTNLRFVALFALWHNLRVFKEGKREGHSPFGILGIDLGEKDWRTLLGYPPVH